MRNCITLICIMSLSVCFADGSRLLARGKNRQPTIELSESEKSFALDSFAGFRFGDSAPESSCFPKQYERYVLSTPFRAFTRADVRYSSFTRKLCEVELSGPVSDWDAASVSNEVAKLQSMVSAQYGIRLHDSGFRMSFANGNVSFENGNVSMEIRGYSSVIVMKVLDKRIVAEDQKACVASKRAISIPDTEGFSELEHIAKTLVKKSVPHDRSKGIVSGGFRNAFGVPGLVPEKCLADKATDTFKSGSTGIVVRLCTRGADDGMTAALFWRDFTITSDGRISAIDAECEAMGMYSNQ